MSASAPVTKPRSPAAGTVKALPVIPLGTCSIADLSRPFSDIVSSGATCPFHAKAHVALGAVPEVDPVGVDVVGGKFMGSEDTLELLGSIGGVERLVDLATRFYAHAFRDQDLRLFMFSDDGAAAHGARLGKWLGASLFLLQFAVCALSQCLSGRSGHPVRLLRVRLTLVLSSFPPPRPSPPPAAEKMGDPSRPWSSERRPWVPDRQRAHGFAWHSHHRPAAQRGLRFKLHDCRAWMRLMGLAVQETGLGDVPAFYDWYVGFISHFVRVYEASAGVYAPADFEWATHPRKVEAYVGTEYKFTDLYH